MKKSSQRVLLKSGVVSFKMPLYVLVFYEQLSTILETLKVKYLKTGFNPFYSPK